VRYLFTHLDDAWTLTLIHLQLSLIPIVLGLLIAVPLGALVQRTTTARRVAKKSFSSARSRCLRTSDRLRTGERNRGAFLCFSLSALASAMAIVASTRAPFNP